MNPVTWLQRNGLDIENNNNAGLINAPMPLIFKSGATRRRRPDWFNGAAFAALDNSQQEHHACLLQLAKEFRPQAQGLCWPQARASINATSKRWKGRSSSTRQWRGFARVGRRH